MKKVGICCLIVSACCASLVMVLLSHPDWVLHSELLAVGKYLATVYGILALTFGILSLLHVPRLKHRVTASICFYSAEIIVLFYTILTLDTFVFHVMDWYPGILRYALFSAYGILYSAWAIVGIVGYLGSKEGMV